MSIKGLIEDGPDDMEMMLLNNIYDAERVNRKMTFTRGFKDLVLDALVRRSYIHIWPDQPGTWMVVLTIKGSATIAEQRVEKKRRAQLRKPSAAIIIKRAVQL